VNNIITLCCRAAVADGLGREAMDGMEGKREWVIWILFNSLKGPKPRQHHPITWGVNHLLANFSAPQIFTNKPPQQNVIHTISTFMSNYRSYLGFLLQGINIVSLQTPFMSNYRKKKKKKSLVYLENNRREVFYEFCSLNCYSVFRPITSFTK